MACGEWVHLWARQTQSHVMSFLTAQCAISSSFGGLEEVRHPQNRQGRRSFYGITSQRDLRHRSRGGHGALSLQDVVVVKGIGRCKAAVSHGTPTGEYNVNKHRTRRHTPTRVAPRDRGANMVTSSETLFPWKGQGFSRARLRSWTRDVFERLSLWNISGMQPLLDEGEHLPSVDTRRCDNGWTEDLLPSTGGLSFYRNIV